MLLLLCALLQEIDGLRTLTDGATRSGCWLPVEVTVRGPFQGDVVVRTDLSVRFVKPVSLPAGATQRLVIPAIVRFTDAKVTASLGRDGKRVPLETALQFCDRDLIVGEVNGQPRVVPLGDGRKAHFFNFVAADWTDPAMLESLDVIVGEAPTAPLELFLAQGGRVVARGTDLSPIVPLENSRFDANEPLVGTLLSSDPWIASKREKAALVLALYFFLMLMALAWLGSRKAGGWMLVALVAACSAIFSVAQLAVPRGQVAAVTYEAEAGDAVVRLTWIVPQKQGTRDFEAAGLAKPMFDSDRAFQVADFDVVIGERTTLRGITRPQAVLTVARRAGPPAVSLTLTPWVAVANESESTLAVYALIANRNAFVKDLAPRERTVASASVDEAAPTAVGYLFFAKHLLLKRDAVFGWYRERDRVYAGLRGADLAESRAKPRFFVVAVGGKGSN